jgi:hypothetical protein
VSNKNLSNEKQPVENDATPVSADKVDRRTAARRIAKVLTYTAPALIALSTARNASADY